MGGLIFEIFSELESRNENPVTFELNGLHETRFLTLFDDWKKEIGEMTGFDLDGTVNRLGLIAFRIAMILTTLRAFEAGPENVPNKLVCIDVDFDNAIAITEVLKRHALNVYWQLPRPNSSAQSDKLEKELNNKADKIATCRQLLDKGHSYATIAENVLGDPKKKATVYKWLNRD